MLTGGSGNDTYYVGAGDTVVENPGGGTDTVFSDADWTLSDNVERLTLTGTAFLARGNSLSNTLNGNAVDNYLDGGGGNDNMIGGAGNDTYVVDQTGDGVSDSSGIDTVIASINYALGSSIENLVLSGSGNLTGQGNNSNNRMTGNSGDNTLLGGSGNDTISGGGGNDRIEGDSGNDTLTGGSGADSFVFDNLPGASNADVITDFESVDRLLLDNAVMAALGVDRQLHRQRRALLCRGRGGRAVTTPPTASSTTPRAASSTTTPTATARARPSSSPHCRTIRRSWHRRSP